MIDEHLSKKVKEAWVPLSNIVQNLYQRRRADPNKPYSHHFGEWKDQAVRVVARERFFAVARERGFNLSTKIMDFWEQDERVEVLEEWRRLNQKKTLQMYNLKSAIDYCRDEASHGHCETDRRKDSQLYMVSNIGGQGVQHPLSDRYSMLSHADVANITLL